MKLFLVRLKKRLFGSCGGGKRSTHKTMSKQDEEMIAHHQKEETHSPFSDFEVFDKIGSGSFGEVYVVRRKRKENGTEKDPQAMHSQPQQQHQQQQQALVQPQHDAPLALKILRFPSPHSSEYISIQKEIQIMRLIGHHQNIVRLHETLSGHKWIGLVMDLHQGGDLLSAIGDDGLAEEKARSYMFQVLLAVQHIHAKGAAHRDIKPENILLSKDGKHVFLSDFGFATPTRMCLHRCGSVPYAAPELFKLQDSEYDAMKVDVWACGVVLYCMVVARWPFDGPSESETKFKITTKDVEFPKHKDAVLSQEFKDVVRFMLTKDPAKRPNVDDVLKHPCFGDCDSPTQVE